MVDSGCCVSHLKLLFSVPYWNDAENAIFEALQTAHELCDTGEMVVFDPQTGDWSEL